MKQNTIRVFIEYHCHHFTASSQDYSITKIVGCPTVEIRNGAAYKVVRVGDFITEEQATELSSRVEITTIRRQP